MTHAATNVAEPIRAYARTAPDAPAIVRATGRVVTFAELDRTIDAIARRALGNGLVPGDLAGLAVENANGPGGTYGTLALSLGLARAGIASKMMSDSGARVAMCFSESDSPAPDGVRVARLEPGWLQPPAPGSVAPVPAQGDENAIFRIFATSDTAGVRKEVAISHGMMARRMRIKNLSVPLPARPVLVAQLGVGGAYAFRELLRVLSAGGTAAIVRTPDQVVEAIRRYRGNHVVVAPGTLAAIVDALPPGEGPFPWIEIFEVGGSEFPDALYATARARLCENLRSSFGSTETGSVADAPRAALVGRPGAVGYVVPGVEVEAVDDDDAPLPTGTEGTLRIRSEYCVDRYVDDPDASAVSFRGGWFYPGDLGSISSDRMLTVSGRAVAAFDRTGTRIGTRAIEETLLSIAGVVDAAAFGAADDAGITRVWAAIVTDGRFRAETLGPACRGLGDAAPVRVMRMRSLPRNANGNVQRGELARLAHAAPAGAAASRGPSS